MKAVRVETSPSWLKSIMQQPDFGAARLAILTDGASVADVCHKPDIKFTIEPDMELADRLNRARHGWQQIYQLLKAQKTAIQPVSGDDRVFMDAGARNRRYLHLNFVSL